MHTMSRGFRVQVLLTPCLARMRLQRCPFDWNSDSQVDLGSHQGWMCGMVQVINDNDEDWCRPTCTTCTFAATYLHCILICELKHLWRLLPRHQQLQIRLQTSQAHEGCQACTTHIEATVLAVKLAASACARHAVR